MATANDVLTIARAELGTKENPRNSNNVKYNTWYYGRPVSGNYPWCMAFVQWCLHQAGITPVIRTASCGALMRAAIRAGEWVTGGYKPGDVVVGAWRPKYEEDDDMTQEQFNEMMDTYLAQLAKQDPSDWSQDAREWAENNGLIRGDAEGNKQYKGFVTREQMVVFMQRLKNL